MKKNTEERRLKLLKLEGDGLNKPEIVKELTAEFEVSKQTVYMDFSQRKTWQPIITEVINAIHKIINRHDQLYRKVSALRLEAKTINDHLNIYNQMRNINRDFFLFCCPEGAKDMELDQIDGYELVWRKKVENQTVGD